MPVEAHPRLDEMSGFWVRLEGRCADALELTCIDDVGGSFFQIHDSEKICRINAILPNFQNVENVVESW